MKGIVISFLVIFLNIGLIKDTKSDKKLIGTWELKYVSMGYEKTENGVYKNNVIGTVGITTITINNDKTAILNNPNNTSNLLEWNSNKKTITLTPKDEKHIDKFFNGTFNYNFNGKKELRLSQEKMTIYLKKKN